MDLAEPKKQNYLTGAAILAATVALTKVVGAIYKIPLFNLLGDAGAGHFNVMYNIYTLILTFSTAGVRGPQAAPCRCGGSTPRGIWSSASSGLWA